MTEPQPVMEQAEQDQLTRQVGRALLTVAGDGWTQIRAEYRSVGRHIEVDVFVTGPDGPPRAMRPPQEVVEGLGRLRQGMYRPGRGTWLSALYMLEPPSSYSAEFEPDVEPRWRRVPPPIGFADELRFFPREEEHIPDWFRMRAGMPPAAGEQPPTPPEGVAGPGGPGAPAGGQPTGGAVPADQMPASPMPGNQPPGYQSAGNPLPDSPAPGSPTPGNPAPGNPTPDSPAPGSPLPGNPAPGNQPPPGDQPPFGNQLPGDQPAGNQPAGDPHPWMPVSAPPGGGPPAG